MSDFLTPANIDMVLHATIEVSGGTEESFLHPSTALLKYGYDLQEMADIKDSLGIIANDKEMQTEAGNFIKLKEKKWRYSITSLAHKVISERNFSKTVGAAKAR